VITRCHGRISIHAQAGTDDLARDRDHGRGLITAILAGSLVAMATSKDPELLAYTNKIPYTMTDAMRASAPHTRTRTHSPVRLKNVSNLLISYFTVYIQVSDRSQC